MPCFRPKLVTREALKPEAQGTNVEANQMADVMDTVAKAVDDIARHNCSQMGASIKEAKEEVTPAVDDHVARDRLPADAVPFCAPEDQPQRVESGEVATEPIVEDEQTEEMKKKALEGQDKARRAFEEEKARKAAARERVAKEKADAEAKRKEEEKLRKQAARERLRALREKVSGRTPTFDSTRPREASAADGIDAVPADVAPCAVCPEANCAETPEKAIGERVVEVCTPDKRSEEASLGDRCTPVDDSSKPDDSESGCLTSGARAAAKTIDLDSMDAVAESPDVTVADQPEAASLDKERPSQVAGATMGAEADDALTAFDHCKAALPVLEQESFPPQPAGDAKVTAAVEEEGTEVEASIDAPVLEPPPSADEPDVTTMDSAEAGPVEEVASVPTAEEVAESPAEVEPLASPAAPEQNAATPLLVPSRGDSAEHPPAMEHEEEEAAEEEPKRQPQLAPPARVTRSFPFLAGPALGKGMPGIQSSNSAAVSSTALAGGRKAPAGPSGAFSRMFGEASKKKCESEEDTGPLDRPPSPSELAAAAEYMADAELEKLAGNFTKVLTKSKAAMNIYHAASGEDAAVEHAKSGRLAIQAHVALDDSDLALQTAEAALERAVGSGSKRAQAIAKLGLTEAHMGLERTKEAARWATAATAEHRELQDDAAIASALELSVKVDLKLDTSWSRVRARKSTQEAIELRRKLSDGKGEADVMLLIAALHLSRQEYEPAYSSADSAVTLARMAEHKRSEATSLTEVGRVLLAAKDDAAVALQTALEAADCFTECDDALGEIDARHTAASAALATEKPEEALEHLEKALQLARRIQDRRKIDASVHEMMQYHTRSNESSEEQSAGAEKALSVMLEEATLAQESGDERRDLAAAQKLASFQLALERPDDALRTATDAHERLQQTSNHKVIAWAVQLIAEVHVARKAFVEALDLARKALDMLQALRDVRSAAALLKLIFEIQVEVGNDREALATYNEVRNTYRDAGWKDEEMEALAVIVHLQHTLKGPKEAMRIAKEVVELCQLNKDAAGEASATLVLSGLHLACKASTEALRSTTRAEKLFRSIEDACGEAQALQSAANIYLENGATDEAVRVMKDAVEVCGQAGEKKEQVLAITKLVELHLYLAQNESEARPGSGGRRPKSLQEAMTATLDLLKLVRSMGDLHAQATALAQLSGLHLMKKDSEAALEAAKECLEVSVAINEPLPVGRALCLVAEAYVALGDMEQAKQAASEAKSVFEMSGDQESIDMADSLVDDAKARQDEAAAAAAKPNSGASHSMHNLMAKAQAKLAPMSTPTWPQAASPPMPAASPAETGPDQDLRRRQLQQADQAGPTLSAFKPVVPTVGVDQLGFERITAASQLLDDDSARAKRQLRSVLHKVRPEWKDTELAAVQEKLKSIGIHNAPELFRVLQSGGPAGLNKLLRGQGQKQLKVQTLEDLREYGESLEPETLD